MSVASLWGRLLRRRRTESRAITSVPWDQGDPVSYVATQDRALSLVPVYAAVRLLADLISTLPLKAYRKSGDERQPMAGLPQLFAQLDDDGSLTDWLHRCVASLALQGNAVGWVTARDGLQFPTAIEWLNVSDVYCDDRVPVSPQWYWRGRYIPSEDIVHIPWFTIPGKVLGLSPIAAYAATVDVGLQAQLYGSSWFASGGVPPGTFKSKSLEIDQTQADIISARLTKAIRQRKTLVYGADWEYAAQTVPPEQAQFIATQKLTATQIAAIYGIPPEMIGGEAGGSLTYNCVDDETEILTLRGWLDHSQVAVGDICLTLNVETGLAEWQPVSSVHVFPGPVEVVQLENKTHSSATTANHRWPVWLAGRISTPNGKRYTYADRWQWVTTETMPTDARVCAAAPVVTPTMAKWDDCLVELVAWLWTEGWIGKHGSVVLTQSQTKNPDHVARIRAALTTMFGPAADLHTRSRPAWRESLEERGIARFHLNAKAGHLLTEHAPRKVVTTEFLASLTRAQLALFVQTSVDADGCRRQDGSGFVLSQRDRPRIDAFQIACSLLGMAGVVRWQESIGMWVMPSSGTPWRKPAGHKHYRTEKVADLVWCVQTSNRTWFARRRGTTYFTGNTIEQNTTNLATLTLRPWLVKLERKFSSILPSRQYVKFNADALIRADLTARMNAYKVADEIGLYTDDEMRAMEDRPPLTAAQKAEIQAAKTPPPAPAPAAVEAAPNGQQAGSREQLLDALIVRLLEEDYIDGEVVPPVLEGRPKGSR